MIKEQAGFTLTELLIAVAITGLIVGFLGTAVYQTVSITRYGSDRLIAAHDLQNTAHWVSLDAQMANEATGGSELVLTLPEESTITYSVVGSELLRRSGSSHITVARHVISANFSVENRLLTVTLSSAPEGRSDVCQEGTYRVYLRPSE